MKWGTTKFGVSGRKVIVVIVSSQVSYRVGSIAVSWCQLKNSGVIHNEEQVVCGLSEHTLKPEGALYS